MRIYLDNAATTKDLTCPYFETAIKSSWGGNSHSIHREGQEAATKIREAEEVIKNHINGHEGTLLWTGSGSQANNLALRAFRSSLYDTVVVSAIEHKSILQHKDKYTGFTLVQPNSFGEILLHEVTDTLTPDTELVSIQMVNNETGIIQPVRMIGRALPKRVIFHCDAVQALGKLPIDVEEDQIDMLTLSAHKAHGPKGLGVLWVRNKILDKHDFEYLGTQPVELIDRFAVAINKMNKQKQSDIDRIAVLEYQFLTSLRESGTQFHHTSSYNRLAGILSLHFPGIDGDDLVFLLSDKGVYISSGSACNKGKINTSHVLTAMGISKEQAQSTVRISIGKINTNAQMQEAASIIANIIKELKNGS